MSMFSRFTNLLRSRGLDRDLRDEVEFHIEMRTKEHLKAGMTESEARKQAHHQFGEVESVIEKMREARFGSVTMLLAITTLLAATIGGLWLAPLQMGRPELSMPALPAAPMGRDLDLRSGSPPPPPRPPTCEEYVAQVNALEINPRSAFDRCGDSKMNRRNTR